MAEEKKVVNVADLFSVEKEKELAPGFKIKLKVLNYGEHLSVLSLTGFKEGEVRTLLQNQMFQLQTIKYATVSVNDKVYDDSNREELVDYYKKLSFPIIVLINEFYNELLAEQDQQIDAIKKK